MSAAHTHGERATFDWIVEEERSRKNLWAAAGLQMMSMPKETKHDSWGYKVQGPPHSPHRDRGVGRGVSVSLECEGWELLSGANGPCSVQNKQTQTLVSLLFISWHTGVGFSLAQRVYDEGGATDPLRGTAGVWLVDAEGGWVELRVCGAVLFFLISSFESTVS